MDLVKLIVSNLENDIFQITLQFCKNIYYSSNIFRSKCRKTLLVKRSENNTASI